MGHFPKLRLGLTVVALLVLIGSAFRYGFFFMNGLDSELATSTLMQSFYTGLKFDLRLAIMLVVPFYAVVWIRLLDPARSPPARTFWAAHFAIITSIVILIFLADLGHYDYLQARLNASAFRFMENPLISLRMVWETYSVLPVLLMLSIFASAVFFALRWLLSFRTPISKRPGRPVRIAVVSCITLFFITGIYGKFSYYPLRWSDAYATTAIFSTDLALNPALNLIDTFATVENENVNMQRLRNNYDNLAGYLGVENPDPESLNFLRYITPTPVTSATPNVIVIMMESFAAHLTGFHGNPLKASPNFDYLAENGLAFTRFYTPGFGTAFGVYTMLTGIPDVSLNRTASRNPSAIKQHIILNDLQDYEKYYFLGGSANWANIRALLTHNIRDLNLYEEGDYPNSPRADVWGISDLHLFAEANRVIRDSDRPFFAMIHLSGNHRPYTIPEDSRDFQLSGIDDDKALANGFDKADGFNSFRFMDHSLGFFMKLARQEGYFKNTIFVLTSDNGEVGKVPGPLHFEEAQRLSYHHAPFVIFGENLDQKPQRITRIATQMDVLPTIVGAIGRPVRNVTLGRNLLDPDNRNSYAFIHRRLGSKSEILLLDDGHLFVSDMGTGSPSLHSYQASDPEWTIVAGDSTRKKLMADYAEGIYDASKYMMFGGSR